VTNVLPIKDRFDKSDPLPDRSQGEGGSSEPHPNQTAHPGNKKAASQNRETAVCCQDHVTNYPPMAGIGKMVRSPGPVPAGFGLDDGEVVVHLAVVAIGCLVCGIIVELSTKVNQV
jgi:hypothetical protein